MVHAMEIAVATRGGRVDAGFGEQNGAWIDGGVARRMTTILGLGVDLATTDDRDRESGDHVFEQHGPSTPH